MAYSYSGAKNTNDVGVNSNGQELTVEQQTIAIEMFEKQTEDEQRNQTQANADAAGEVIGSTVDVLLNTALSVNQGSTQKPTDVCAIDSSPTANDLNVVELDTKSTESWSGITDKTSVDSFSGVTDTNVLDSANAAVSENSQGFIDGALEMAGNVAGGAVDMASSVIKGVGDVASGAVDVAGNVASGAVDVAGAVIGGIGSVFEGL